MNLTQDQVMALIGAKELEIVALRIENAELQRRIEELTQKEAKREE